MTQTHFCMLARDTIRIGGDDRAAFLQGLVSNDVALCLPNKPIYASLLTPQGKFLYDMFVWNAGDHFLIDCAEGQGAGLLQKLKAHKLRSKISLDDVSDNFSLYAAWGAQPADMGRWIPDPRLSALGWRHLALVGTLPPITANATENDYDLHRLSLGVTDGVRDMISGKSTIQEGNIDLLNGVSWTKGCYMGQELTARIHYRALLKKRLFPVRIVGVAPAPETPITYIGKDCGDMRGSNGNLGMALIDIETAESTQAAEVPLSCGETQLFVLDSSLPAS